VDADRQALMDVLREVRARLALPDNEFMWSSWEDADAALAEVDGLIEWLEAGVLPDRFAISVLFLPTGPIQEVAISSGWGDDFLVLADRYDAAEARVFRKQ
jgi:hypothetical protein